MEPYSNSPEKYESILDDLSRSLISLSRHGIHILDENTESFGFGTRDYAVFWCDADGIELPDIDPEKYTIILLTEEEFEAAREELGFRMNGTMPE